jgi:hypothetical protein
LAGYVAYIEKVRNGYTILSENMKDGGYFGDISVYWIRLLKWILEKWFCSILLYSNELERGGGGC